MPSITKAHVAVITGGIVLFVLLIFADTKPRSKPGGEKEVVDQVAGVNFAQLLADAKEALDPSAKAAIAELEKGFDHATNPQKSALFDSLVKNWDKVQKPLIAAYYTGQKADMQPSAANWKMAGDRYFTATGFAKEEQRTALFQLAMKSYEKALELDPSFTEAKINLAACYVEGTSDPMKGIGMLQEVEKTDSNNVNLQMNFAMFSERSGQWDKAITRYNKVLAIDPSFIEAYLHLADAYEKKGDKAMVIESLEKYVRVVDDVTSKTEVQSYIDKLKNS